MIEAHGLVYDYPGKRALDDVGFHIAAGSVTALVGPNGAGKTTLLRCLAALDVPLAGRLAIDGVDVLAEPRACHRRLGFLSDTFGVWPELSVRQSLHYVAEANGVRGAAAAEAVLRTAGRLGLADRLDQAAGTLSRGLRQRLAIGQAIIHAPRVLLLDEPASGLDPEARHTLAALFRTLRAEGMTLLVSSHILAELAEYSTHMLVLRDGRVVEQRALISATPDGEALRAVFATAVPGLAALLAGCAGVSAVVVEPGDAAARFDLAGGLSARAQLVASLVAAGLPLAGLEAQGSRLQESYLASVGGGARS